MSEPHQHGINYILDLRAVGSIPAKLNNLLARFTCGIDHEDMSNLRMTALETLEIPEAWGSFEVQYGVGIGHLNPTLLRSRAHSRIVSRTNSLASQ